MPARAAVDTAEFRDDLDDELKGVVGKGPRSRRELVRTSVYILTGTVSLVALVLSVFTFLGEMPWDARFYTDWFLVALVFGVGPFGYFANQDLKQIEQMDEKFPDFLRDLAESARSGMTLPRALVTASKGSYGALTADIKKMSAQVEWGVSFTEALGRFSGRTKSPLIHRTVSLIIEARHAGGNVVDILTAASEDAREIKQIVAMRNNQMGAYSMVIYITFFVFLAVILILQAQFVPAFKKAVDAAGGNVQVGGLAFADFDPETFRTAFFHASIIQAIGGGLVGGVLTRGSPVAGLRSVIVMAGVAWIAFRTVGV